MKRIPELDGLRGIAIGLVLVNHFLVHGLSVRSGSIWEYFQIAGRLTWSGVDLFFVLSGFLIGGILIDARKSENYFQVFYTRRLLRIAPIYAAVLVLGWISVITGLFTPAEAYGIGPWYAYALLLQNFWMAKENAYGGLLAISWSLAIEEQFYLTLPAIIRYIDRYRWIIFAGIIAAPILRTIIFYALPDHRLGIYVLMPCRADALLLGVFGALIVRNPAKCEMLERNPAILWGSLSVLLLGATAMTLHPAWMTGIQLDSAGYTWLALLYLCLLLLAVVQPHTWLGTLLRLKPLRWLGQIAYAVYLLHLLALASIHHRAQALFATLALAGLSWHFLEKPILKLGRRFRYL